MAITELEESRLERLERKLDQLLSLIQPNTVMVRTHYTAKEAGTLLRLSAWTIRQYCKAGTIRATRRKRVPGGRADWSIPASEIARFQNRIPANPPEVVSTQA